ncbi:MAG: outer membrane protein assembly factor BamD [Bacteroidetes bacterium]|nr:outer membrane protein assembly factor BamD [Bacteroidota bacterium]
MNKIVTFIVCCCLLTACSHKTVKVAKSKSFSKIIRSKDYEYKYKMAEQFYAEKKYSFAQQLYEDLFPYIKGTERYEDMFYKVAYCYYYQRDYANAENYFKTFTETFPGSKKAEECDFMRAYTYYKQSPAVNLDQTNTNKAMNMMQAFINTHPNSTRIKEANTIIDQCREKLEEKDAKSAQLYFDMGYFKAASIAYATVNENFPDSRKGDEYKWKSIEAYYKYAELSFEEKQQERFEKIVADCTDFNERFSDSKYLQDVAKIKNQSLEYLKKIKK